MLYLDAHFRMSEYQVWILMPQKVLQHSLVLGTERGIDGDGGAASGARLGKIFLIWHVGFAIYSGFPN